MTTFSAETTDTKYTLEIVQRNEDGTYVVSQWLDDEYHGAKDMTAHEIIWQVVEQKIKATKEYEKLLVSVGDYLAIQGLKK